MKITSVKGLSKSSIENFFTTNWGSTKMVISSGIYDCTTLNGFAVLNVEGTIIGLITYKAREGECEIISLDSIEKGKGVGSVLIGEVEKTASENNWSVIKLITTNDNLEALKFYQKRGYHLSNLYANAVDKARKFKPEIPLTGNDGIPIRDEIELKKWLSK